MKRNCEACKHWRQIVEGPEAIELDGNKLGECRRHAPVRMQDGITYGTASTIKIKDGWPGTWSNEFCGDWEMRP